MLAMRRAGGARSHRHYNPQGMLAPTFVSGQLFLGQTRTSPWRSPRYRGGQTGRSRAQAQAILARNRCRSELAMRRAGGARSHRHYNPQGKLAPTFVSGQLFLGQTRASPWRSPRYRGGQTGRSRAQAQAILARNRCRSELARDAPRGRRSISQALQPSRHARSYICFGPIIPGADARVPLALTSISWGTNRAVARAGTGDTGPKQM